MEEKEVEWYYTNQAVRGEGLSVMCVGVNVARLLDSRATQQLCIRPGKTNINIITSQSVYCFLANFYSSILKINDTSNKSLIGYQEFRRLNGNSLVVFLGTSAITAHLPVIARTQLNNTAALSTLNYRMKCWM